jgi:hypothetical protein
LSLIKNIKQKEGVADYMEFYTSRIEIKYLLNNHKMEDVLSFLEHFGSMDAHSEGKEGYEVSTFYLATWRSFTRTAKNHGHLRIRSYPADHKMYLEEKTVVRDLRFKKRYLISNNTGEMLKSFSKLSQIESYSRVNGFDFSNSVFFISDFDKLEISYTRVAYFVNYEGLLFRATIDSNLAAPTGINFSPDCYILEVKTNEMDFKAVLEIILKLFGLLPQKLSKYKLVNSSEVFY